MLPNIYETINVIKKANITDKRTAKADFNVINFPPTKTLANIIIDANLPLQGTKLFVTIANSLSLGESIILAETTPAALQPKPIHIVRTIFPWDFAFLKILSKLKAILGKYPKSSRNVKSGKNIAIGGNITATTQLRVLNIPSTKIPLTNG